MQRPSKKPREPKKRPTPVRDAAVAVVRGIEARAHEERWSPRRMRRELHRASRIVSPGTWAKAIRVALGHGVRALKDFRQLTMFEGGGLMGSVFA